jgi:tubulin--tyrosine ligase
MIGQTVRPTYYRPGELYKYNGTTHSKPSAANSQEEWILVDGTPASCVQIGIYHFFQERGPIDLVVSGPNYGRNSTAVFALSSGTMGGALEASVCKKRAIAVSYAFTSRIHEPKQIASASRLSTKIIEHLAANWGDADLYSVNVPLVPDVENKKVLWTNMLQNYWGPASCFEEVEDEADSEPGKEEQKIRDGALMAQNGETAPNATSHTHKHFKWAPRFSDVYKSVEESEPGNDGWTVKEGFTR